MFSHSFIIWRAVEANKFIRRRWEREFIFIRLSLSLDPLSSQLFSIFIEWPKNNQWRKSRMNHEMTVQTDVKLQNIGPVSDLGPHMEVAQFRNWKDQNPRGLWVYTVINKEKKTDLGQFCLQSKGSLLMPFCTENQAFNDIKNWFFFQNICQKCQHKDK